MRSARVSVNQITDGLNWHYDFVPHGEKSDFSRTKPGMSCVVHAGEKKDDLVGVDFATNLEKRYVCHPGTAYAFPGYAIKHRTQRLFAKAGNRYSIAFFILFKEAVTADIDDYIHNKWGGFCNDNYEDRKRKRKTKSKSCKRNRETAFGGDAS